MLAGRLEEAHAFAEQALDLAREHQERGHEAYALRLLGEIAAHHLPQTSTKPPTTTVRPSPGRRSWHAPAPGALSSWPGRLYQQVGASSLLPYPRLSLLRAMEMTFWLPRAEAELAKVA